MSQATAVLSYTRKDDEFFGGYITAFRKTLESAVHVVTGVEDFRIFQDIDGIVLGEQWRKKLSDVIDAAHFLVPMMSPLFFSSQPCREEVGLFLTHEQQLRRNDLILPVYFLSSPKLDKPQEKAKDPVAVELAKRQMFDWRENAKVPLGDPAARDAILTLAKAVAAAIERLEPPGRSAPDSAILAADAHVAQVHGQTKREQPKERDILWVDDNPDSNVWERHALESYGVRFTLATDTATADALLRSNEYASVISDLSRPGDHRAGFTLLSHIRARGVHTPYFIYSSSKPSKHVRQAMELGAQGLTDDPNELVGMIVAAIR